VSQLKYELLYDSFIEPTIEAKIVTFNQKLAEVMLKKKKKVKFVLNFDKSKCS